MSQFWVNSHTFLRELLLHEFWKILQKYFGKIQNSTIFLNSVKTNKTEERRRNIQKMKTNERSKIKKYDQIDANFWSSFFLDEFFCLWLCARERERERGHLPWVTLLSLPTLMTDFLQQIGLDRAGLILKCHKTSLQFCFVYKTMQSIGQWW